MNILWNRTDTIAIAVSGGIDSMVLLDKVRRTGCYNKLYVLHVNHQLRDASVEELTMITNYCNEHNIELVVHTIPKGYFDLTKSIQNEARVVRYQFFETVIHERGINYLLTAHHLDDQTETILFRLLTNRYHYQPIDILSVDYRDSYKIVRPLLDESKSDLIDYAKVHNVPFMTDESNLENKYLRNFIRNNVFTVLEQSSLNKYNLLHLADYMRDADALVMERVSIFNTAIESNVVSRVALTRENRLVAERVIVLLIQKYAHVYSVSHKLIEEIIRVLQSDATHASFEVTPGWHIQIAYDKLIVRNKNEKIDEYIEVTLPGKYYFNDYVIDVKYVFEPITIRTRKDGDVIEINGGHQKISRIMKDFKVPIYERSKIPLVCVGKQVIAVGNYKYNHHPFNKDIIITKEN
ncbi:tRNA lysidine(34) synthetase TilS [Macrococcus animalis]|uniref:tRNA lysidine(34) synthetase TilS n=1 Tax=Macrococcus animalis TaxID=3395467 RepID=UPI0039BE41CD